MGRDIGSISVDFPKRFGFSDWEKLIETFSSTAYALPLGHGKLTEFLRVGQDDNDFDWSLEKVDRSGFHNILLAKLSKGERIGFVLVNSEEAYDSVHVWDETDGSENTTILFSPSDICPVIEGTSISDFHRYLPSIYKSCISVCAHFDLKVEQLVDR